MKKIYFIALTLLLGIVQGAWADTTGNWQDYRDTSWGSDYSTSTDFTISNAAQLAQLAYMVTMVPYANKNFSGKTITLAADIDLSAHYWTPIGARGSYFSGIFDGAGHTISGMYINENRLHNGLFGYIYGVDGSVKIKNLKITDSWINAKSYFTGTIVGFAENCRIENCFVDSSVEITSTAAQSGDGEELIATGGIVGRLFYGFAELWGCVCGASVSGTEKVGGLVGEVVSAHVVACLYTGSSINGGSSTTQAALIGNINGGDHLFYNLYTNSALDGKNGQDKRGYIISIPSLGVTYDFVSQAESNVTYDVSGITYYTYNNWPYTNYSFIAYNGTMYCAAYQRIPFSVSAPLGYVPSTVTATTGTLTQEGRTYSLLTAASNCTLSSTPVLTAWDGDGTGTELDPYLVKTTDDLRWIAAYVNTATNDHYSAKYFQLANDIAFDGTANNFTTIGNTNSKYFAGTFDGQGHTISGININADGRQSLFGTVDGATIKNVKLSSCTFISTNENAAANAAGGIVASAGNNGVTIENCHVSESVTIESGNDSGGIIGKTNAGDVYIRGCTSGATISTRNSDACVGGIIGYCGRDQSSPTTDVSISNCLYYGTSLSGDSNRKGGIVGSFYVNTYNNSSRVNLSNNYYTYPTAAIKGSGVWREKYSSSYDRTYGAGDIADNNIVGNDSHGAVRAHAVTSSEDIQDMGTPGTPVENGITPYTYGVKYGNAYYSHVLALLNNEDNTALISQYAGQTYNVKLRGRTLYKDGCWNTLCLPFNFSLGSSIFTVVNKYELKELDINRDYYLREDYENGDVNKPYRTGIKDGTLYLFFKDATKNATSITAGKPYIVRWEKVENYNPLNPTVYDYVNPMFENATIVNANPATVTSQDGKVSFLSNYAPLSFETENRSILFLGAGNTLYYPSGAGATNVNSFHAHFQLNGVQMSESPSSNDDDDDNFIPQGGGFARAFVLDIEDNAASIQNPINVQNDSGEWFSIHGIRLGAKPSTKGVYVTKGRKVVIK